MLRQGKKIEAKEQRLMMNFKLLFAYIIIKKEKKFKKRGFNTDKGSLFEDLCNVSLDWPSSKDI